jgi:hypothetical protein
MASSDLNSLNLGQPTHVARQSGSWFDPNTWQGGSVPGNGANVAIASNLSVTYDGKSDARLAAVDIDGQLKFATQSDTKMVVDTASVSAGGRLEIGTQSNPVRAKAEILIADNGPLDLGRDPQQLSRGLISEGQVEIHGVAKTAHLKVAVDPRAGDRTLTLQNAPINWQVGDRLVLTGTRFTPGANGQSWDSLAQDEEVTIQSISGNQITLNRALVYDHSTPRGDLKAYVANQSRNILIASENGDRLPPAQRGHTFLSGNDKIDIRYAEFKDLGRTDKSRPVDNFRTTGGTFPKRVLDAQGNPVVGDRTNIAGRYAAHIHEASRSNPAVMVGNVVSGSSGWGFVVHNSAAILEQNVAYDVAGGAFVTEDGSETGAMRNNIAIKTGSTLDGYDEKQGTGVHDFARTGVGYWFAGRLMENEGNVAASSRGAGMFYLQRGVDLKPVSISNLPVPALAKNSLSATTVSVEQPPIQNFSNNEVFASGTGLEVIKDFPQQNHDLRTVMNGLKAWEVEKGTELQYTSHYTMKNFDLTSAKTTRYWQNKGVVLQRNTQDMVFTNMRAEGFDKGISVQEPSSEGPAALSDRGLFWVDLQLANNKANFENFDLPPEKWLKQSDLTPGRLDFQLSGDSDFVVTTDEVKDYVDIRGTKTDSLGAIAVPFGDESLSLNYQDVLRLASKGYYTLPDGSRAAIIEEYFSDRITGETKKYPFVVTFKENVWTQDAPNLGPLDPKSLSGPTSVSVPTSRYGSRMSPIAPISANLTAAADATANLTANLTDDLTAATAEANPVAPLQERGLTAFLPADDNLINSEGTLLPQQGALVDESLLMAGEVPLSLSPALPSALPSTLPLPADPIALGSVTNPVDPVESAVSNDQDLLVATDLMQTPATVGL